ncbi:hypothetical protein TNIN_61461 [Trichonephila inaurata madagascariensis]|uniref:Uncharacterized protein n=1 Tax=Trichonephila inaurata madagascariensis TaxID=2747483 RepID=A0A8X7CC11_9ARAC|nr:hypothetical protein TNIN_61461 [Trichonephila inaurata madagascariensis]
MQGIMVSVPPQKFCNKSSESTDMSTILTQFSKLKEPLSEIYFENMEYVSRSIKRIPLQGMNRSAYATSVQSLHAIW